MRSRAASPKAIHGNKNSKGQCACIKTNTPMPIAGTVATIAIAMENDVLYSDSHQPERIGGGIHLIDARLNGQAFFVSCSKALTEAALMVAKACCVI